MPKQGIYKSWAAWKVNSDGKGWSSSPQGDRNPGGSLSVLGSNLLADNEGSGVATRNLSITGISTSGALILSWVGVKTSLFAGPPTANNGNTCTQEQSQDYGPTFTQYTLRSYSTVAAAGGSDHQVTVTKSSGAAEELTIAMIALSSGAVGTRKSSVNRTATGAGATHTSGTVTMTGAGILVAVGSGTGDVNATAPTQTWPGDWSVIRSVARNSAQAPSGHVPLYLATKAVAGAGTYSVDVQVTIDEGIVLSLFGVQ
jgi:hypothetical protein